VLNPIFYPYKGGTEKVILEVYKRLAKKHNVTVITSAPIEKNRPSVQHMFGLKVVRLRTYQEHVPIFPMPFLFFDGLKKALAEAKCDIYHVNNRYQFFGDEVSVVKNMDRKLAITIHNALPKGIDPLTDEMGHFYDRLWGRKLMHFCDLITGVSSYTIKTTVPKSERYKTHLVLNGVDKKLYKKISKNNSNVVAVRERLGLRGTTVMTNGRLATQKGQIYLLKAVSELIEEGYDLDLLIVGNGPLKKYLYRKAKKLGLEERFNIVYGIDDKRLPYYYNASDLFSLPSLYEPAGLALMEALSCEVPTVITKIGGMPEIAGNGAFYTRAKDHYGLKEKIRYVLENKKMADKIAKKGRERMIKYHNWDKIAKQYENLFLDTISY
jgi:glycosyltransferase involved in cell wall biosynthesis